MPDLPIPAKAFLAEKAALAELVTLNIQELMKLLGLRRSSLRELRQQPDFPKPLGLTRVLSWRAIDIQRWLEQQSVKAGNPPAQQQQG